MMIAALNTVHGAVTEYDMPFVSLASIGGRYFGAGPSGIFELTGGTDNGVAIAADIRTGKLDFGGSYKKSVSDVFIEASSAGELALQVYTDTATFSYSLDNPSTFMTNRRGKIGKGTKTRRWQFGVTNAAGCDFTINNFSALVAILSRRI